MSLKTDLVAIREAHEARLVQLDKLFTGQDPVRDALRKASFERCCEDSGKTFDASFAQLPKNITIDAQITAVHDHYPKIIAAVRSAFPVAYEPELIKSALTSFGGAYKKLF